MNELPAPPSPAAAPSVLPPPVGAASQTAPLLRPGASSRWQVAIATALALGTLAALFLAWNSQQRVKALEIELV